MALITASRKAASGTGKRSMGLDQGSILLVLYTAFSEAVNGHRFLRLQE